MRGVVLIGLLAVCVVAHARMYQWVNNSTGRVELSGTPPAWYRSDQGGPRIQVFDNGQMVDDTAIELSAAQNQKLREAAFEEFELRRQAEQVKRLERVARREAARQAQRRFEEEPVVTDRALPVGGAAATSDELPEVLDATVIDRLKGLIQLWDQQTGGSN